MTARIASAAALSLVLAAACGGDDVPVDAELGMHTLTGTVRYEDRPQLESGSLGAVQPKPARGVQISLVTEDDGEELAAGITGDDGTFMLQYTRDVPAEPAHLRVLALSTLPERPIKVVNGSSQVHAFGGPVFGNEAFTQDLLITDSSGESEAFNVFDQLVGNADAIRVELSLAPVSLTAIWERGSTDGTYYSGDNKLHLLGASSDDDGYDDSVILHEAGHFVEDSVGRSDSPGGSHDGSPTNPTLAWSEGFSTYWAMTVLGKPFYGDSSSGGGWSYDADESLTRADAGGGLSQLVAEDMISEILWDMGDAGAGDDDALAGDQTVVRRVQPDYLRVAALRQVGRAGVDLVDFLDGWFMANGLAQCTAVRAIVTTSHTFPYDYAGPAGPCP